MLEQIQAITALYKELPDAIGWSSHGPFLHYAPKELVNSEYRYLLSSIAVYNQTDSTLAEVRILYKGDFGFSPHVEYSRHDAPVNWSHNVQGKELIAHDIIPREIVELSIYNPTPEFEVMQVIVDGKRITELMTRRALARAYPSPLWMRLLLPLFGLLGLATFGFIGWAVYTSHAQQKNNDLLSAMLKQLPACQFKVFENPPDGSREKELDRLLKQQEDWLPHILAANKERSVERLRLRNPVILCEPVAQQAP